jgi:undecaprenyl-diphosphatase
VSPTGAWTTRTALRSERRWLTVVAVASVFAFATVAAVVERNPRGTNLDLAVSARLFETTDASAVLAVVGRILDLVGGNLVSIVIVVLATMLLGSGRHPFLAVYLFASALGGVLLSTSVKTFVDRPRPPTVGAIIAESTSSFPSGHATSGITTFVALGVVCLVALRPGLRWWCAGPLMTFGVVIGISRVAVGVHWPTDVLGGWALGSAWTATAALMVVLMVQRRRPLLSPPLAAP